jgi:hypothetical protein
MATDIKAEISRIAYWKQRGSEYDLQRALPWHLPRVGAAPEQIELAERNAGIRFPEPFKMFLSCADGWRGFYLSTDLFGTDDFVAGKASRILARSDVLAFFAEEGVSSAEATVIGASDFDTDVFILFATTSTTLPGGIVWLAGDEIDRYESFDDFLSAMVNYNAQIAQRLIERVKPSSQG